MVKESPKPKKSVVLMKFNGNNQSVANSITKEIVFIKLKTIIIMAKIDILKTILQRKTKVDGTRHLDINLDEMAREIGCNVNDVYLLLKQLCISKDIKALVKHGWGNDYCLTVLEKSTIWSDWQ